MVIILAALVPPALLAFLIVSASNTHGVGWIAVPPSWDSRCGGFCGGNDDDSEFDNDRGSDNEYMAAAVFNDVFVLFLL